MNQSHLGSNRGPPEPVEKPRAWAAVWVACWHTGFSFGTKLDPLRELALLLLLTWLCSLLWTVKLCPNKPKKKCILFYFFAFQTVMMVWKSTAALSFYLLQTELLNRVTFYSGQGEGRLCHNYCFRVLCLPDALGFPETGLKGEWYSRWLWRQVGSWREDPETEGGRCVAWGPALGRLKQNCESEAERMLGLWAFFFFLSPGKLTN